LRDAVEAARAAQAKWASATAYNRGQVLYRLAEMMEGKRGELAEAISSVEGIEPRNKANLKGASKKASSADQVAAAIDRIVCYAGWADKYGQVLGCNNPVAGPYYNFTVPEPTGVVAVIAPDRPSLLGLVSLIAPVICSGNAVVALASETNPIPAAIFAEACATCDLPAGVVNLLTGRRDELIPHFASHREIAAIHAAGVSHEHARTLRAGAAENLKRVLVRDSDLAWTDNACESPGWIEPFVEMKTIWHPAGV